MAEDKTRIQVPQEPNKQEPNDGKTQAFKVAEHGSGAESDPDIDALPVTQVRHDAGNSNKESREDDEATRLKSAALPDEVVHTTNSGEEGDITAVRPAVQTDTRIPSAHSSSPTIARATPSSASDHSQDKTLQHHADLDQTLARGSAAHTTHARPMEPKNKPSKNRDPHATTAVNTGLAREGYLRRLAEAKDEIAKKYPGKRILKDRFVLLETLGAGGMGNVYLAKDLLREEMEDSEPHVAIKVLNDECRNLPGALQSLQREAKKAQTLSHPNIVTVYDFDRDDETAFISMEYIDGDSLKDFLRKNAHIPYEKNIYIIERVARGLAYAHVEGFAHADIKPANIFLSKTGTVKILDFGIAKAFKDVQKFKQADADTLTEGALTPAYASLEMLEGEMAMPVDDVYSLAVMAYEIIRGKHPFIGEDGHPVPANIARQKGLKVEKINGIPRRHMRALRKGLEFERDKRFQNAGEFIDAIKARNIKKDMMLLGGAAVVTTALFFAINKGLDQVVPSVSSLKPELAEVGSTILEGDELLNLGDVSMAHGLYAHAWELASDLTTDDVDEREKTFMILSDRMANVSDLLIERALAEGVNEYELRELSIALESMKKHELSTNHKKIDKAINKIDRKLESIED